MKQDFICQKDVYYMSERSYFCSRLTETVMCQKYLLVMSERVKCHNDIYKLSERCFWAITALKISCQKGIFIVSEFIFLWFYTICQNILFRSERTFIT